MRTLRRLIVAIIVALPLVAQADVESSFGAGAVSCREYIAVSSGTPDRDVYAQWASGYLVALAAHTTHDLPAGLDVPGIATELRITCAQDPSRTIFVATNSIARKYRLAN